MNKKKLLEIRDISFQINHNTVLKDISIDIYDKEILFIIGPNGAGKSTLVKIILKLLKPDKGELIFKNRKLNREVISQNFGYVPQYTDYDKSFPITVYEFLELEKEGISIKEICKVLKIVHADDLSQKRLGQLSGGEFQKVLIARSLLRDPKILILDEPTNNLDVNSQSKLFRLLENLKKDKGISIVVISHDLNVVSQNADRILCLNKVIGCQGVPSEVLTDEIIKKVYGKHLGFYGHKQ